MVFVMHFGLYFRFLLQKIFGMVFVMQFGFMNFKPKKKIKAGSMEDPEFSF